MVHEPSLKSRTDRQKPLHSFLMSKREELGQLSSPSVPHLGHREAKALQRNTAAVIGLSSTDQITLYRDGALLGVGSAEYTACDHATSSIGWIDGYALAGLSRRTL